MPLEHFADPATGAMPRVFGGPGRYLQGPGILAHTGRYLTHLGYRHVAVLASARSQQAEGKALLEGVDNAGFHLSLASFGGECSLEEIERHAEALQSASPPVDLLIAAGGGKCVDTGKSVAARLKIPLVVAPTLASNDAPCSAVSVIYTPEGVSDSVEFHIQSPLLVVVDTQVIANAAERYLVAGMGDAMATWYEARATAKKSTGVAAIGGRPTFTAGALGEFCAEILYRDGVHAAEAVLKSSVTDTLEAVAEANTLLSGLGFESGGLAAAHAIAQGYTTVKSVETNFLHGEMVAMGVLTQLMLENDLEEATRAARFFADVGLPIHLGQLGMTPGHTSEINALVKDALDFPFIGNMPMEVTGEKLHQAILAAHQLGTEVTGIKGDTAYQRLQS